MRVSSCEVSAPTSGDDVEDRYPDDPIMRVCYECMSESLRVVAVYAWRWTHSVRCRDNAVSGTSYYPRRIEIFIVFVVDYCANYLRSSLHSIQLIICTGQW